MLYLPNPINNKGHAMTIAELVKDITLKYYSKNGKFNGQLMDLFLESYYKNKDIDFETKKAVWVELEKNGKL
jgi:hypothetical protein